MKGRFEKLGPIITKRNTLLDTIEDVIDPKITTPDLTMMSRLNNIRHNNRNHDSQSANPKRGGPTL